IKKRRLQKTRRRGDPPHFLQVLISGDFKSNDFVIADSRGFTGTFFVCAHSKGLASTDVGHRVTMEQSVVESRQNVTVQGQSLLQSSWRALHLMLPPR